MKAIRVRAPRGVWNMLREHSKREEFKTGLLCGMIFTCLCAAFVIAFLQ